MLVCPECQFENPDENRFCQKCGTSLTERACTACGAMVQLGTEYCPACGEPYGQVWLAVVQAKTSIPAPAATAKTTTETADEPEVAAKLDQSCAEQDVPSAATAPSATAATDPSTAPATPDDEAFGYLDRRSRYRLLEPLQTEAIATTGANVRVLDCQPLRPSQLELLARIQDLTETEESGLPDLFQLPAIALDYLELEPPLAPALPLLQDAWEDRGQIFLLLEDRQDLPPLQQLWDEWELEPFQALHLFHQMADLWLELQPRGYATSVIESHNLRSDEDQLLYLQRLYADDPNTPPTLAQLGSFWAQLLAAHPTLAECEVLTQLCQDLQHETISTPNLLRSRLKAIAMELQDAPQTLDESITEIPDGDLLPEGEPDSGDTTADLTLPLPSASQSVASNVDAAVANSPTPLDLPTLEADNDTEDDDPNLGEGEGDDVPTIILPMNLVSLDDAGRTDVGRQREHNEDYFYIQTALRKSESGTGRQLHAQGLYILCDGMGGHASGEVASEMAAKTLCQYFDKHWDETELPTETVIRNGVFAANQAIFDMNQQNDSSGSGRMGTTLVMLLVHNKQGAIAHVGDSRLYRYTRRQGLEQITVDHEVGQREIQRGVEPALAYARPDAYQLTQALGPRGEQFVNPDVQFLELNEDVLFLLCSDGLTDNDVLEKHCESHVEPLLSSQANLEQGVNALVSLANEHNGHDNITVVLVRVKLRPNLTQAKV